MRTSAQDAPPGRFRCTFLTRIAGVILLALMVLAWLAPPVAAEGIAMDLRPAGLAGPQMDAAALSPQPMLRGGALATQATYMVQSGDTLDGIAERLGVSPKQLAAANGLTDPNRIIAGQTLRVAGGAGAALPAPAGRELVRVQCWPWPPTQGQTLAVWLRARQPVTFTLTFRGQEYPVLASGERAWALVPVPPLTPPGPAPLSIQAGAEVYRVDVPVQAGAFPTVNIPASASDPILTDAAKVRAETERTAAIFAAYTPGGWVPSSRFRLPLDGDFPRTSPFGSRRTYGNSPAVSAHAGEDFSAMPGTPVYAPAAGQVILAEPLFVRGNAVILDHGNGVFTGYWHLSELAVQSGEQVASGQLLGAVGSTGLSTGAHLHWELRINRMAVDPLQWTAQ